ncbi:MAG: hypothetical protein ACYDEQ_08320, partial [Desulfocucumaceae bacterium]
MKPRLLIPIMLILALFLIGGCSGKNTGVSVVTEKVKSGIQSGTDFISGKTEAQDSVTIIPKTGGKASQVLVDVGSIVS